MQKSGDVVIPMQQSTNKPLDIQYLVSSGESLWRMEKLPSLPIFAERVVAFLQALSRKLLAGQRGYPDVATFAFWCRQAAVIKEKERYVNCTNQRGRGLIFHIAPSNVPVNFAFSMVAGLLAGNANIVRVPSKDFPQVTLICEAISGLLEETFADLAPYLCVVRYPSGHEATSVLSALCDVRVIWGGDETIANIRRYPLGPRASEITFADRFSMAVINADAYLATQDKQKVASDFYNDTYLTDQNACTSPRLVVWLGDEKERAQEAFWKALEAHLIAAQYTLQPSQAVGKLTAFYTAAAAFPMRMVSGKNQTIFRVQVPTLTSELPDYFYHSGFFFEYNAKDILEMTAVLNDKMQTLSYYGVERETLLRLVAHLPGRGLDRVVPIGQTMDFALVWDGYDLIYGMSRQVSIA